MKVGIAVALSLAASIACAGTTHVNGYFKKDGTYVEPHYQTTPDDSKLNNYSTKGNTNPYTGKEGTVDPYLAPAPKPAYTPPPIQPIKPLQPIKPIKPLNSF